MTIYIIYITISIIWASYASYKTKTFGGKLHNMCLSFFINLILFPLALLYAIITKKFKTKI